MILAEIEVIKKVENLDHGFLLWIDFTVRIRKSWKDIREKLNQK